ncbi:MAG: CinA family protein [Proteobacteria bacterium]|nr:CinA family protein [Pseudomonadota bacterium]
MQALCDQFLQTQYSRCYYLANKIIKCAKQKKFTIGSAESCTGGLISSFLTAIPGSSEVFKIGLVTYCASSKKKLCNVSESDVSYNDAVNANTAKQMSSSLVEQFNVDIGISTTGFAGPSGSEIGLVFIGFANKSKIQARKCNFFGNRENIRIQATFYALKILILMMI